MPNWLQILDLGLSLMIGPFLRIKGLQYPINYHFDIHRTFWNLNLKKDLSCIFVVEKLDHSLIVLSAVGITFSS